MARRIHRKVLSEGLRNIQAQVAKSEDDPGLPAGSDLVFVCDVLMHVEKRAEWLQTIHAQMRSESRLVLIDFKEGDLPEGPPEKIKVPKAEVIRLARKRASHSRRTAPTYCRIRSSWCLSGVEQGMNETFTVRVIR